MPPLLNCRTALLIALTGLSLSAAAGRKLRVLFIGNSYTYTNDLPQLVANIAASLGDTLIYDSYTPGGYRFADHAADPLCAQKIRSASWNYIVLQEQSRLPSWPTGSFFSQSYQHAYMLDTMIRAADPCANRMFFMTWGYRDGDAPFCASFPHVCTYSGMDSMIQLHYRGLADTAVMRSLGITFAPGTPFLPLRTAQVSPVGAVWRHIRMHHPGIELYQADGSHPSEAGSYAAASTFYAALFRRDPALSSYNFTLAAAEATQIKQAAKLIVYDSLHNWRIGMEDGELRADFTPTKPGGNLVIFLNQSTPMNSSQWSFGDGTGSAGSSVFHTYPGPGIYNVRLIVTRGGCSDTAYSTVSTIRTGMGGTGSLKGFTLAPNPAGHTLHISAESGIGRCSIRIVSSGGQLVYQGETDGEGRSEIDLSGYSSGVYSILLSRDGEAIQRATFVRQ